MNDHFLGPLRLDFGDWGPNIGRIAVTLADMWWITNSLSLPVLIPAVTMSDGASVPRPLWWFLPPWGDPSTWAAILHDYLCQRIETGVPVPGCETRLACDWQFYLALRASGINWASAGIAWVGVRIGGLFGA
jgi:hypothetical protein